MNRRGINRRQCVPTSMAQRIFNNTGRFTQQIRHECL